MKEAQSVERAPQLGVRSGALSGGQCNPSLYSNGANMQHTFIILNGQAQARVYDTKELRAAFLHYSNSSIKVAEMHLAHEGPYMHATQFVGMCKELGLVEPEGKMSGIVLGMIYALSRSDDEDNQGLAFNQFLDALVSLAFECETNVAGILQDEFEKRAVVSRPASAWRLFRSTSVTGATPPPASDLSPAPVPAPAPCFRRHVSFASGEERPVNQWQAVLDLPSPKKPDRQQVRFQHTDQLRESLNDRGITPLSRAHSLANSRATSAANSRRQSECGVFGDDHVNVDDTEPHGTLTIREGIQYTKYSERPMVAKMLKERSTDKVLRPKSATMFREMRSPIHGCPGDRLINPLTRTCILDRASVDKNFGDASSDADGTNLGGAKSSPQDSVTDEDGCSVSSLEDLLSNKQNSSLTPPKLSPVKTPSAGDSSPAGSSGSSQCTPRKPPAISTATPAAPQAAAPDALLSRPPRGGQWAVRAPQTSGSGTAASSNTRFVFAPSAPLSATTTSPPFADSGSRSGRLSSPASDPLVGRVRGHSSSGIATKPMCSLLQQQAGHASPGHGGRVEGKANTCRGPLRSNSNLAGAWKPAGRSSTPDWSVSASRNSRVGSTPCSPAPPTRRSILTSNSGAEVVQARPATSKPQESPVHTADAEDSSSPSQPPVSSFRSQPSVNADEAKGGLNLTHATSSGARSFTGAARMQAAAVDTHTQQAATTLTSVLQLSSTKESEPAKSLGSPPSGSYDARASFLLKKRAEMEAKLAMIEQKLSGKPVPKR